MFQHNPYFSARYHERLQAVTPEEILETLPGVTSIPTAKISSRLSRATEKPASGLLRAPQLPRERPGAAAGFARRPGPRALSPAEHDLPLLSLRAVLPGGTCRRNRPASRRPGPARGAAFGQGNEAPQRRATRARCRAVRRRVERRCRATTAPCFPWNFSAPTGKKASVSFSKC